MNRPTPLGGRAVHSGAQRGLCWRGSGRAAAFCRGCNAAPVSQLGELAEAARRRAGRLAGPGRAGAAVFGRVGTGALSRSSAPAAKPESLQGNFCGSADMGSGKLAMPDASVGLPVRGWPHGRARCNRPPQEGAGAARPEVEGACSGRVASTARDAIGRGRSAAAPTPRPPRSSAGRTHSPARAACARAPPARLSADLNPLRSWCW
jgi:hypothetical protein